MDLGQNPVCLVDSELQLRGSEGKNILAEYGHGARCDPIPASIKSLVLGHDRVQPQSYRRPRSRPADSPDPVKANSLQGAHFYAGSGMK
jgi:hypothetical protein